MSERNYGIDLLRLLLMFMVVLLHTLGNGGVLNSTTLFSANYFLSWTLECLCFCAVNCYALITGYVTYDRKYKFSSIMMIWLNMILYTLSVTFAVWIFTDETPSISYFRNAFFQPQDNSLWYVSAYTGVYILIPVLNGAVKSFTRRQAKSFILISVFFLSILPTFLHVDPFSQHNGYSVIWLAYLYLIGAIIKKFRIDQLLSARFSGLVYLLCIILVLLSKFIPAMLTHRFLGHVCFDWLLVNYISPPMLLAAIALFTLFANLHLRSGFIQFIKRFSPAAFGVYLIHCQPYLFSFCSNRFSFLADCSPIPMVFGAIGITLAIYCPCILADLVRGTVFKKLKIQEYIQRIEEKYLSWAIIHN